MFGPWRYIAFPVFFVVATAQSVWAVGGDDPPVRTDTTKTCTDGLIWDADTRRCVKPADSSLRDTERLQAVREFAYAGQYRNAERVLDAVTDQTLDLVLTYRGFLARKQGRMAQAHDWYARALAQNPDNLLARSYLGQAHVAAGNLTLARHELSQIRARGGRETWAEISLRMALRSGRTGGSASSAPTL